MVGISLFFSQVAVAVWLGSWFGQPPKSYFHRVLPLVETAYLSQLSDAERKSLVARKSDWKKCQREMVRFFGPGEKRPQYLIGFQLGPEGKLVPWVHCEAGGQIFFWYGAGKNSYHSFPALLSGRPSSQFGKKTLLVAPEALIIDRLPLEEGAQWIELSAFVPEFAPSQFRGATKFFFEELGFLADSWIQHRDGTISLVYP